MADGLLTRDEFRAAVLARDNDKCVICGAPARDAHHILERRLWDDEGYYLDNGASVCTHCHIHAEQTLISCEDLRRACGIKKPHLPEHLYDEYEYDKWGNILVSGGGRIRGELFFDESVQIALDAGDVLRLFSPYVKHPRTNHLPWSHPDDDDRVIRDMSNLQTSNVVVTVKMDGEQTSMYRDRVHARSLDPVHGPDHSFVNIVQSRIGYQLPEGWRVCGENLHAEHSIHYRNLKSYFYVFSIWDEKNVCLTWDETVEWAELLDLITVPVLYRGPWNEEKIKACWQPTYDGDEMEGYVARVSGTIPFSLHRVSVAKYVRPSFNRMHGRQVFIPNEITSREVKKP